MASTGLSPAKAVLLAVHLATEAHISALRTLISQQRRTFRTEIVLRVLLTYLPESIPSADYVSILQNLVDGNVVSQDTNSPIDASSLGEITAEQAAKKVRTLQLLPLLWSNAPTDTPDDPIVLFLIHRSLRIDENAGLITEVPELLGPFLHNSSYLRTWMISRVLPLLRLSYEYYPNIATLTSISSFDSLDSEAAVALLLSGASKPETGQPETVGRDLRGLVGPWMYGHSRLARKKLQNSTSFDAQRITSLDEAPITNEKCACWEDVFQWITEQAVTSWETAVQAIEQWDGPGEIDLGEYGDGTEWLDEDEQQYLERRYARSALAAAYLVPEASIEALMGVHRIVSRIIALLDLDRIPTLEVSGALLIPVGGLADTYSRKDVAFLRNGLLEEQNTLTRPAEASLKFLHTMLISAYLMTKEGTRMTVRRATELALRQDKEDQMSEFKNLMLFDDGRFGNRGEDKFWVRFRNEVLWLQSWGSEELVEGSDIGSGRGIFGTLSREVLELALLKGLISNNRLCIFL